jgi:tRNA A37 threonylcarbamoyltransferase TsaD
MNNQTLKKHSTNTAPTRLFFSILTLTPDNAAIIAVALFSLLGGVQL